MKIAIDARELRTTTGRYIERLLFYLQTIDSSHDYIILLRPEDMAGWQPSNPRFKAMPCPYKEFTFDEQLGLKKLLDDLRPDLVHFGMTQQPIRYQGKVVTTIHDLTTIRFNNPSKNWLAFKLKQRVYRHVIKSVAKKSKIIITPSQFVKDDLVKFSGVDPGKIVVTYESADIIPKHGEPVDSLMHKDFIMYAGRPTPHKNLNRLIEAFMSLSVSQPGLYLALVGKTDANYHQIEDRVRAAGYANIIFTGFISDQQLRWAYEHCKAYVVPSLSEGFGLPGLEAMLHGAPLLSSNATCLPEIYGDGALYFDPLDIKSISGVVTNILSNAALRQQLIEAGKLQASKYSWQRMAEQTLEVYKTVLGES